MDFYFSVFIFAFSTSITPGPNTVMIMASGVNHGIRRSLPHLSGIALGFPVLTVCIGFGLGAVFTAYPEVETGMKVFSVAYLLYLAYMIATSVPNAKESKRKPFTFTQAAAFQWINPKTWFVALGAISAFTTSDADFMLEVGVISFFFFICAVLSSALWLVFGASFKDHLKDELRGRIFNISMGVLLVLSIAPTVFELVSKYV